MPEDNSFTIISSRLSSNTKKQLTELVSSLWNDLKQQESRAIESPQFTVYKPCRDRFYQVAALATICDHEHRLEILGLWNELQESYARRVKAKLKEKQVQMAED